MSHTLEIDHRTAGGHPPYRLERTPRGRIASAFEPSPDNHQALSRALHHAIEGEVRFDNGSRGLYATDASNYRQVPIGVVVPRSVNDVVAAVALCREHGAPIVMRGGGTSLAGQGCNVAVLIDFSKYLNRIRVIDAVQRIAEVEPGVVLDSLRDAAEKHHLTFGPDPSTHDHCTLGGMIGNNSCGVHSVMAGRTSDNVRSLEVLTYDGLRMEVGPTPDEEFRAIVAAGGRRAEIYRALDRFRRRYGDAIRQRFPKIPRRVSGYENLNELLPENGFNVARALVGTESTCVTVLSAQLQLVPSPQSRILVAIGFPDVFVAADHVPEVLAYHPIALEGLDDLFIGFVKRKGLHGDFIKKMPQGNGWLFAEFGADDGASQADAARLARDFAAKGFATDLERDPGQQAKLWAVRKDGLPATAKVPEWPETYEGWEDSAVPREKLGSYLRQFKALLHKHGYESTLYGHFGDGLVHCRINFDLETELGLDNWHSFLSEAADLVVSCGGSLSGEHGDGQSKAEFLEKMYGPELIQAFREFKEIWDPDWKMNPGKIVDPYPAVSNLRIGPRLRAPETRSHFAYPDDGGSFARATKRCVGVGTCRRLDSHNGVMCPSYMVTREERHSTRGRARMLFEMLHGGAITGGWRSHEVEEALSLCLGCKGCKSDCPVNVDIATYKAEFRARYYRWRPRPRAAYSMGLIHQWSRLAAMAPFAVNSLLQAPGLSPLLKRIGGIAPERRIPRYASQPFADWFKQRRPVRKNGERIVLWPDTFNNYFRPQTAIAATRVLEDLGFDVVIPDRPLCCGRPLYDWGMLDAARALWQQVLSSLGSEIERGTPVVGLEPACVSAFRDELPGLFADDERAKKLSKQTLFFSEFLDKYAPQAPLPQLSRPALVQIHCHHHAIIKADAEHSVLKRLGLSSDVPPSGCCGMAGSFGFEADKYEVSMKAAERVLLPRVRAASPDTLLLADGFSCREQIEQATGRATVHIAEAVAGLAV